MFGDIFKKKRKLMPRLGRIQMAVQRRSNPFLHKLEEELTRKYNTVLYQEELFWFQNARMEWLEKWNRNTNYFHSTTKIKRRHNKVEALLNSEGQ